MATVETIESGSLKFPATERALSHPNGLLAVSRDLSVDLLLAAYRRGIFPWYEEEPLVLWWSPDPRSVLLPGALRLSRSLRRSLRRDHFRLTADRAFTQVMAGCAAPRRQRGTWITPRMAQAYAALHQAGHAHSIEAWDRDGQLVGGLYGVSLGGAFFGESMFSRSADASKAALAALVRLQRPQGLSLIDCQVESAHLNTLGARNIPRAEFEALLREATGDSRRCRDWQLDIDSGDLA